MFRAEHETGNATRSKWSRISVAGVRAPPDSSVSNNGDYDIVRFEEMELVLGFAANSTGGLKYETGSHYNIAVASSLETGRRFHFPEP
jgi:hypothetical protein